LISEPQLYRKKTYRGKPGPVFGRYIYGRAVNDDENCGVKARPAERRTCDGASNEKGKGLLGHVYNPRDRFLVRRAGRRPFADTLHLLKTRPSTPNPSPLVKCLCVRAAAIRGDRAPAEGGEEGGFCNSPPFLSVCPRFARNCFFPSPRRGNHNDPSGARGNVATELPSLCRPGLGSVCSCADRHD
jgi:hypothetical protein